MIFIFILYLYDIFYYLYLYLFIYLFICLFIYSIIYLFIYLQKEYNLLLLAPLMQTALTKNLI